MNNVIDREVLSHIAEMEKCLSAFRGMRQIWANMSANGALSCMHEFYPKGQAERMAIANDFYREQIHVLQQALVYAEKVKHHMMDKSQKMDNFTAYQKGKSETARAIIVYIQSLPDDDNGTLMSKEGTKGGLINWIFKSFSPNMSYELLENDEEEG